MKTLKTVECQSLSGRSTITYELGCNEKKDTHLRLTGNSGGGKFSNEWVPVTEILASDQPITPALLQSFFKGKSTNSPGFVMAALVNEGLVEISNDKPRKYSRVKTTKKNPKNKKK